LPKEKDHEEQLDHIHVNAKALLPSDLGYYTFPGSLTTPPCTEYVTWFVLKRPVTVSAVEIQQFEKLYRHNARPIEAFFDRVVLQTK
jgi:carbonic anhydrase